MTETTPSPEPGRRRSWALAKLLGLLAVPLAIFGGGAGYALWASSGEGGGDPVEVVIPEGANATEIVDLLAEHEVVRAPALFRWVVRLRGAAGDLKAGRYELRRGLSYGEALAALRTGPEVEFVRFTIPEGLLVDQTAARVAAETHISAADFLEAVESGRHRPQMLPEGVSSLEGFLFPKTYDILADATADDVVAMLVAQFEEEVTGLEWDRAEALGRTPFEIVVIASMIEREVRVAEERPIVSAVIHNRLALPMRLQIDATVQYVLFARDGAYADVVLFEHLEIDHPYNTYRRDGLPPGPIASPGRAAIEAALAPADVPYLYYVVRNEQGEHAFATTLEEHEANIRRYRDGG